MRRRRVPNRPRPSVAEVRTFGSSRQACTGRDHSQIAGRWCAAVRIQCIIAKKRHLTTHVLDCLADPVRAAKPITDAKEQSLVPIHGLRHNTESSADLRVRLPGQDSCLDDGPILSVRDQRNRCAVQGRVLRGRCRVRVLPARIPILQEEIVVAARISRSSSTREGRRQGWLSRSCKTRLKRQQQDRNGLYFSKSWSTLNIVPRAINSPRHSTIAAPRRSPGSNRWDLPLELNHRWPGFGNYPCQPPAPAPPCPCAR